MQVIALRALRQFWRRHPQVDDFIRDNRIVFDIAGNKHRLIVHVAYSFRRALVKLVGTHAEYDRIDALATLIETHERKHWPIDPPAAVDAMLYRMETAGHTRADLARLLGSRSRASEVLSRKRPLTLPIIGKPSREWNVPADCLIDVEDRAAA